MKKIAIITKTVTVKYKIESESGVIKQSPLVESKKVVYRFLGIPVYIETTIINFTNA